MLAFVFVFVLYIYFIISIFFFFSFKIYFCPFDFSDNYLTNTNITKNINKNYLNDTNENKCLKFCLFFFISFFFFRQTLKTCIKFAFQVKVQLTGIQI